MIGLADVAHGWPSALQLELDGSGRPAPAVAALDLDAPATDREVAIAVRVLAGLRRIVIGVGGTAERRAAVADVVDVCLAEDATSRCSVAVDDPVAGLAELEQRAAATPVAATTLAWVLRAVAPLPVLDALGVESAAYSSLLAGQEFRDWLARRGPARPPDGDSRVRMTRAGDRLFVVLDRPRRRNAVDRRMRDALVEALTVAEADPSLRVELSGEGACFSAGGDLDEFGSVDDVALGHVIRVAAGAAAPLHRLADRAVARVHGRCFGAGVELPAFAGRVIAAADTQFVLPEVGMGLIPGAGGTVSLTGRIGRWRTFWLALSGHALDVPTALQWGLVDAVE